MAVADELVTILGVEVGNNAIAKIDGFNNALAAILGTMGSLGTAAAQAATGTVSLATGASLQAVELSRLSTRTGLSSGALQELGFAAGKVGVNARSVFEDIAGLQKQFGDTGQSAEEVLLDLADQLQALSTGQAADLGASLGLGEDTLTLLRLGREGIGLLRQEARGLGGVIPEEAILRGAEFQDSLHDMLFALNGLGAAFALAFTPALQKAVATFTDWLKDNRDWLDLGIDSIMKGVSDGFSNFWSVLKNILGVFDPLTDALEPFLGSMESVDLISTLITGALTGLSLILAPLIGKALLLGGAVGGITWGLGDLFKHLFKGEGAFEDFFHYAEERWPNLAGAIRSAGRLIQEVFCGALEGSRSTSTSVLDWVCHMFGKALDIIDKVVEAVEEFYETFKEDFPKLKKQVSEFINNLGDLKNKAIQAFGTMLIVLSPILGPLALVAGLILACYAAVEKLSEVSKKMPSLQEVMEDEIPFTRRATVPSSTPSTPTPGPTTNDNRTQSLVIQVYDHLQAEYLAQSFVGPPPNHAGGTGAQGGS